MGTATGACALSENVSRSSAAKERVRIQKPPRGKERFLASLGMTDCRNVPQTAGLKPASTTTNSSSKCDTALEPVGHSLKPVLLALEDAGGAHAAADAHGDHTVACVAALELADDGGREFCAGAAERM